MRTYRGKTKEGKWVKGWYIKTDFADYIVPSEYVVNWKVFIEVIPETVGQSTGKTDINEEEMFAGDIIKFDYEYGVGHYETRQGEIYWDEKTSGFYVSKVLRIPIYQAISPEVIGTIHSEKKNESKDTKTD